MAAVITAAGIAGVSRVEVVNDELSVEIDADHFLQAATELRDNPATSFQQLMDVCGVDYLAYGCLLYTSPSPRDGLLSRMPSSA